MDNRPTRPVLQQPHHSSATALPAMGHCHSATSHGVLPSHCQPWGTATLPPSVGHCHPTANQASSVHGAAHSISTDHSRGQVLQGDKVTEGAQWGTNGHTKSGWDIPELHVPQSHHEEPGLVQLRATPPGEKAPGKISAPLSPVPARPLGAPQHNLLRCCHQGTCKHPWPHPSRTAPLQPPAPGCSRRTDLQHPSPACVTGMVPRAQVGSACAEPALRASPGKAPNAAAPPAPCAQLQPGQSRALQGGCGWRRVPVAPRCQLCPGTAP